jgi:hypothetical protein
MTILSILHATSCAEYRNTGKAKRQLGDEWAPSELEVGKVLVTQLDLGSLFVANSTRTPGICALRIQMVVLQNRELRLVFSACLGKFVLPNNLPARFHSLHRPVVSGQATMKRETEGDWLVPERAEN